MRMIRIKSKVVLAAIALASLACFGERDTAIYRGKLTSDMNANGFRIIGLNSPTNNSDAANKKYVDDVISAIPSVDGEARLLPKYLHFLSFDDTYADDAAWYYSQYGGGGACAVRSANGIVERNYDWTLDDAAEFVVRVSGNDTRFASIGVASVGTNLTEQFVTSGKWSRYYKALAGAVLDGINENGVVAEINVTDGASGWRTSGEVHPLAAVRWALDNGTSARMAATNLAAKVYVSAGAPFNFHYMIADESETWVVENGVASNVTAIAAKRVMTNFPIIPDSYAGEGKERYQLLLGGAEMSAAHFTRAYANDTNWLSEFGGSAAVMSAFKTEWDNGGKEAHRGKTMDSKPFWQSVHTSVYDITNRVLRVAVQEQDDWYTFAVDASSIDAYTKSETDGLLAEKLDGPTDSTLTLTGKAADAKATGDALAGKVPIDKDGIAVAEGTSGAALQIGNAGTGHDDATSPYEVTLDCYGLFTIRNYMRPNDRVTFRIPYSMTGMTGDFTLATTDDIPLPVDISGKLDVIRLAPAYSTSTTHAVGAIVSHNGTIYQCISATSGAWNPTKWAARNLRTLFDAEIDAENPRFSNEVLSVGLNISTNDVAAIGQMVDIIHDFPIDPTTGATSIGALLAALAAAVAWLRKRTQLLDNEGKATDQFATDFLQKDVAISAVQNIVNGMFDNGDTTAYPRTTGEG